MKTAFPTLLALAACTNVLAIELLPIVSVTADFRDIEALKSANSVTVIDPETIARREAKHLDQILNAAPNVNFSSGASRGRFIQVRGIGERSQFKDPLDASIGMSIDGIDYSGIGLAAVLFDVQQVEVLRGPQGTQFGSAAMAGAVNIQSRQPTRDFGGQITASAGNYNTRSLGAVLNGTLAEGLLGRISAQQNRSDGFVDNDYLGRDNTNNIDEEALKAQLNWSATRDLRLGLTAHYIDVDNGYNAFSLHNSRDIPSDDPGHDRQQTTAFALTSTWNGASQFELQTSLTTEKSDLEYGFDWDWSNISEGSRGSENNRRQREAHTLDARLVSKPGAAILGGADWVAGLYAAQRNVNLAYSDSWEDINYGGPWLSTFDSSFDTQRQALYGQLNWALSDDIDLTTGLRFERYNNNYEDSAGVKTRQQDNMWGGKITLSYTGIDNNLLYASISRGYKIGGVNGQAVGEVLLDPSTPADTAAFLIARANFEAESLINYEIGVKGRYLEDKLDLALTAFYMDRNNMQANAWVLFPPTEWKSYLDNIKDGHNAGIELESRWHINQALTVFTTLGLLNTELGQMTVLDVDTGGPLEQTGRDQAHAPNYQYNVGAALVLVEGLTLSIELDGKNSFYFSNSHNYHSKRYNLVHMTLAYQINDLALSFWGRNLGDKEYKTRGFYFDNTFPDYDGSNTRGYYQLGEPHVFGVSGSYSF